MSIYPSHQAVYDFINSYWREHDGSPTVREIVTGLKSAGSKSSQGKVQNSLKRLEESGLIERIKRKSRNIRLVNSRRPAPMTFPAVTVQDLPGLPIRGEIAAGYCHDPFTESNEYFQMEYPGRKTDDYVLKVSGDSMVGAAIPDGAYVGIRRVPENYKPKAGQIVAVWVEGMGTTLKHFYQSDSVVVLKASNPKYDPIIVNLTEQEIKVQGKHIFTHWQSAALA